jgi:glutathione S-transferase
MKLYWSPRSPFVRKVMVCAYELGIAERIDRIRALVSLTQTNADVLEVNPVGRIPALVLDNGDVLYDSHVICEYLDAEYGDSRLFPRVKAARWDALRRLALADGMLETSILWRAERSRPAAQQPAEMLAAFDRKIATALAALERDSARLHEDQVDIGDLAIGCALAYLDFRFPELDWRARHERIAAWFESFDRRPSMQQTIPYDER